MPQRVLWLDVAALRWKELNWSEAERRLSTASASLFYFNHNNYSFYGLLEAVFFHQFVRGSFTDSGH